MVALQQRVGFGLQLVEVFLFDLQVAHQLLLQQAKTKLKHHAHQPEHVGEKGSTHGVALLLAWDVLVDVLVSPVEHQLLLLPVVHPHDLLGHFLHDLLELLKPLSPSERHFLQIAETTYKSEARIQTLNLVLVYL